MATELKVPSLGMDMEEATILRWLVEEGAEVSKGDPVLEIETDKTSFEIEANAEGEIQNLRGEEGETLPVGTTLAYIAAPGEEVPAAKAPKQEGPGHEEPEKETPETSNGKAPLAGEGPDKTEEASLPEPGGDEPNGDRRKVRASPAARRLALERGVDLHDLAGSGPGGRIYLSDVLGADGRQETAPEEPPVPEEPPAAVVAEDAARREPLSRVRRIGAERTASSFSEVPHFYLTREMEVDRLLELQGRLREKMDPAPGVTELLLLAIARTLRDHPRLNARYAEGELELREQANLGLAVATEAGLLVPVLKGADTMPLKELVPVVKGLVRRAREGKLATEDLSGGTFTLSNLGMMGIDSFNAIINAPEAAILAVGKVKTVPEWSGGEWLPRRIITVTLSVDHRVADGADGARFLEDLQAVLKDWELLL